MKPWLGILGLVCAAHAWGQAHDEGIAAGRAANPTLRAFISAPSAQSVVPGYNSAPPETGYYGLPNLAAPSAALLAQCRTAGPADVRCQAITTAHDSAANPRPAIASTDPAVVAATAIANDPSCDPGRDHRHLCRVRDPATPGVAGHVRSAELL